MISLHDIVRDSKSGCYFHLFEVGILYFELQPGFEYRIDSTSIVFLSGARYVVHRTDGNWKCFVGFSVLQDHCSLVCNPISQDKFNMIWGLCTNFK